MAYSNYADALYGYQKYLVGENDGIPTYDGPLDEETKELVPDLVELNKNGFLTVDSQPGVLNDETWQRSYVEFFVKKSVWDKLYAFLMYSDLFYVYCDISNPLSCSSCSSWPLTIDIVDGVGICETAFNPSSMDAETTFEILTEGCTPTAKENIGKNLVWAVVVDPVWGRTDLLKRMVEAMQ